VKGGTVADGARLGLGEAASVCGHANGDGQGDE
jgi:hypothetical protein